MVDVVDPDNIQTSTGEQGTTTGTAKVVWDDPEKFLFMIAQGLQTFDSKGVPEAIKYNFTKKLSVKSFLQNKNGSTATVDIVDDIDAEIKDYDVIFEDDDEGDPTDTIKKSFGVDYGRTLALRHFIIVVKCQADDLDNNPLPTEGELYKTTGGASERLKNSTVVFSGYTELLTVNVFDQSGTLTYRGIENILNDIIINGTISYDMIAGVGVSFLRNSNSFVRLNLGEKTIFNEGGLPDQLITGGLKNSNSDIVGGTAIFLPFFNKSGFGPTKYWTMKEMLKYVLTGYVSDREDTSILQIDRDRHFGQIDKVKSFLNFSLTVLDDVVGLSVKEPHDIDITGQGVLEALNTLVDKTATHFMKFVYDSDGRFGIEIKAKDVQNQNSKHLPLELSAGSLGSEYLDENIIENSSLTFNRQNSNVGRVIVYGAKLRINTLITTFGNSVTGAKFPKLSKKPNELDPSSGLITFKDHLDFVVVKDTTPEKGIKEVIYKMNTFNFVDSHSTILSFNRRVTGTGITKEQLNEDDDKYTAFFEELSAPMISKKLNVAFDDITTSQSIDVQTWTAQKISTDDGVQFIELLPLNASEIGQVLKVQIKDGKKGTISVTSVGSKSATATPATDKLKDMEDASELESSIPAGKVFLDEIITNNLIPLFMRLSITCDYRIKGIASATEALQGFDFDPKTHKTEKVYDESFKLAIQFKDATYSSTQKAFVALTDGFLSGSSGETKPLEAIQQKAKDLLDKYVTIPQNTGSVTISGAQDRVQVGDTIKQIKSFRESSAGQGIIQDGEFEFDFPAIINTVAMTFDKGYGLETTVTMGGIDDL